MKRGKLIQRILGATLAFALIGGILAGLLATLALAVPGDQNQALAQDGKTWYVDDDKVDCPEADFSTIQDAMDASNFGDIIIVCPGNYHEIDPIIEPGREVVIEEGAVWRVRSLVLLEWAHLIMRGILYRQAGYSITLAGEGASISLPGPGWMQRDYVPFLIVDEAQTDKGTYSAYESVQITAVVLDQNGTGVSANVTARIEEPDGSTETVSLSEIGTGSYEGTFTDTSVNGTYRVAIQAENVGYTGHTIWLSFEVDDSSVLPEENVTVCVATSTGTGTVCFTPSHGSIEDLAAVPAYSLPSVTFPHGMFAFQISGLIPGQTVTLPIELPSPVPVGAVWWKYDNGRWQSLPNLSDDGDRIMVIKLTDGGMGDRDDIPGQITDPGGPGNPMTVGWETSPINRAVVLTPWIALLAAIMASASLLVLKRRSRERDYARR